MTTEDFNRITHTIPKLPGVYRFIHADGTILYVGKAKNLLNRLTSYFGERRDREMKTRVLVKMAHHIEFTIVNTEQDALLLECAMIKAHQPRYNVMLKDGKSYPYVCIKSEPFPRVFMTRRIVKDGSQYFGPYTSVNQVQLVFDLIKRLFPLRTCALDLSDDKIATGKYKVCLEYHIKNCKGPCVGLESAGEYAARVAQIKNILKGRLATVRQYLKDEMAAAVAKLDFEYAQRCKESLALLEDYQGKSPIVNPSIGDVDVFAIESDEKFACINYIKVRAGVVVHTFTLEWTKNIESDDQTLLEQAMVYLRERFDSQVNQVLVPFACTPPGHDIEFVVPKIGDKAKLVHLAGQNAKYHLLQLRKQVANRTGKQTPAERILRTLQADLHMDELPVHIECFDNSNFHGSFPVSACVVFKNAKPAKSEYRHYNVKTVEGPNDFATMEEVVYRRYKRLLEENKPLPQLVIIDGGKGQLSAAMKSIDALGLRQRITVVGIAKQLEEVFFPDDPVPLYIDKKSESLKLIQQARNEAHRFGITFHRQQRSRHFTHTELTDIVGIGPKTANALLSAFGSVAHIKTMSLTELARVVGVSAATKVYEYFNVTQPTPTSNDQSTVHGQE